MAGECTETRYCKETHLFVKQNICIREIHVKKQMKTTSCSYSHCKREWLTAMINSKDTLEADNQGNEKVMELHKD